MKRIETLGEYQELASRTCKDLGDKQANVFHMNQGLITETGEFLDIMKANFAYGKEIDLVHVGEELGDIAWYVANKSRFLKPTISFRGIEEHKTMYPLDVVQATFEDEFESQGRNTMGVSNLVYALCPKSVTLDKQDNDSYTGYPDMVILKVAAEYFGLDFWDVLTRNIEKLMVRYPEKFTDDAALNRDLSAERQALEARRSTAPDTSRCNGSDSDVS